MTKPSNRIDRRRFLGGTAALAAGVAAGSCAPARVGTVCPQSTPTWPLAGKAPALSNLTRGRQPNLLLVLTDQERWAGNLPSTLHRPNFDRLRSSAVSFENTFCSYPLCSPSRSSIQNGLYPHQSGITQNVIFPVGKKSLNPEAPHLGSVLRSAGYRIGYQGKWDLSRGPSYYTMNLSDRGRAGDYGFEGHCGAQPDQEYGYRADDQVVQQACQWLRGQDPARPWFLCCSIINPHDICHPQLKPDDSIRPDVVLPASLHDDLTNKPADQRRMRDSRIAHFNQIISPEAKPFYQYTERDWKLFLSFYYDLIELTDRYLGELLAALEDTDMLRDTIVIYTSDHGELGGAHGFSGKYEGYEEDLHVPLYFFHPDLDKREERAMVSNVSIAPTIAGLAGLEWPAPAGRDLSGLVAGGAGPRDDAVFAETETRVNAGVYRRMMAMRMVRTERWKYSYSFYRVQDGQLYDLEADPIEMNNLFHDPAHRGIRKELEDRLRAWQLETNDYFELPR